MSKHLFLFAVFAAGAAYGQTDRPLASVPQSWIGFQASSDAIDRRLVSEIHAMKWWDACAAWGVEARKRVLVRRHWALQEYLRDGRYINGLDMGGVRDSKIPAIGMTTCGAFAVLGKPTRRNVTANAHGQHIQYVFEARHVNVYTESATGDGNALVRSVQY